MAASTYAMDRGALPRGDGAQGRSSLASLARDTDLALGGPHMAELERAPRQPPVPEEKGLRVVTMGAPVDGAST